MMTFKNRSELTAINLINAVLGAVLFASPWLAGFREVEAASWNARICGLAVLVLAVAAATDLQEWDLQEWDLQEWEEWVNGSLGLWTIVAPWVLGFAGTTVAVWTHVAVGGAVAVLAAIELWLIHSGPPARAA